MRSARPTADNCEVASVLPSLRSEQGAAPLALLRSYPCVLAGTKRFFKSFRPHKAENNHHTKEVLWNTHLTPSLKRLKAEKEKNEKEIEQINHKITRLENRQKYFEDGERKRRTHRLCTIAGTLESIAPEIKELDITEVMELLEYVFHKEDVQQAVSRMKKAHDLRNRNAKEG